MPRRRILFVTDLDVWLLQESGQIVRKAGNQSLYNTLRGYARAGWEVEVLTAKDVHGGIETLPDGIRIRREEMLLQRPVRLVRKALARLRPTVPASTTPGQQAPRTQLAPETIDNPGRWAVFQMDMGARALARCLAWRPDVIYGYEIYGAPVAVTLGRALRIPSVTRFQGTLLGAWADDLTVMRRFRTHVAAMRAPANLLVMADDGTLGDVVLGRLGAPMERVRFWMNGVVKEDIEAARERRTNASTNPTSSVDRARPSVATQRAPLRLLTASRLVEWKRVDRVLDVLAQLPADVPTWTLEIAGDGPERSALVEMACRLGLADRVKFLGPISHDEVMDRLVQADAYLSLYDLSNLSNGVLEAAVAGVPVFALDVGGTSHLVEDGVTGVLVRPDRLFDDGTRRLARLLSDDSWRAKLSGGALEAGRTRIRTWEQRMQLEITEVEALLASR